MRRQLSGPESQARREESFRRLHASYGDAVLGYALRRVRRPEDAADVVAETFLVAWRRLGDVPEGEGARPWLYAVARRTLANQRRGDRRRTHLGERLRAELAVVVPDHADDVVGRADAEALLATLSPADREVLELSAWEGLEPREIAVVTGATALAVRTRLSRVRRRLRETHLGGDPPRGNDPGPPGHHPVTTPRPDREEDR